MKTLYLLRHTHTVTAPPPGLGDYERLLSSQGNKEALVLGQFMQEHDMYPEFILSSSSVRTMQTTRQIFSVLFSNILYSKAGIKVSSNFDRKLYQASAEKLFMAIHQMEDNLQSLLVVGHNPGIADLALMLGGAKSPQQFHDYTPGTLAVFKTECPRWADIAPEKLLLEKVFVPKI